MSNSIDRTALNALVGGLAGGTLVGNDDSQFSTLLGVGVGATVGVMGDFRLNQEIKERANRLAVKDKVVSVDSEYVFKDSKTSKEKEEELLNQARKYANNNSNTASKLNTDDILGTLNQNTLTEYETQLKNGFDKDTVTYHNSLFKDGRDNRYNPTTDGIDNKHLNITPYTRLSSKATVKEREDALRFQLIKNGYKDRELDYKMARLVGLANIPDTTLTFDDSVMTINGNVPIKLTSIGETADGIKTSYFQNSSVYEDVTQVNPFGHLILDPTGNAAKQFKATANTVDHKLYKLQSLLQGQSGLTPDDAIGLAQKLVSHLPPEEQVKILEKVSEKFNANYSYNNSMSDELRSKIDGTNQRPKMTPNTYSARRGSTVEFGDGLRINPVTGLLDTDKPIRVIGITSDNGISEAQNKQLIKKINNMRGSELLTGVKGDNVTGLPSQYVFTNNGVRIDNPYNQVFDSQVDVGRDVGTMGNREYSLHGIGDTNRETKELYDLLGGTKQYDTSVALRSMTFDPNTKVGTSTLGDVVSQVFGSNVTTEDGFALLSKKAAQTFVRREKGSVVFNSNSTGHFDITHPYHKALLKGEMTMQEIKDYAKRSHTTLNKTSTDRLKKAYDILTHLKGIEDNVNNHKEYVQEILKSKKIDQKTKDLISKSDKKPTTINRILDKRYLDKLKKSNLFLRGNSSLSYKEDRQGQALAINEIKGEIKKLSTKNLEDSIDSAEWHLKNDGYNEKIQKSLGAYYLVPGSQLGRDSGGEVLRVPNKFNNYTLEGIHGTGALDNDLNFYMDKITMSFKGKLEVDKLDHTKLYSVSSKAQAGLVDHETNTKLLLLQEFAEKDKLAFDGKSFTFTLHNEAYDQLHNNLVDTVNSQPNIKARALRGLVESGEYRPADKAELLKQAKVFGLEKEVNHFITKGESTIQKGNTSVKVLEDMTREVSIPVKQFHDLPLNMSFNMKSNVGLQPSVPSLNKAFNEKVVEAFEPLLGKSMSISVGKKLVPILGNVLNTSTDTLEKQLKPNQTVSQLLSERVSESLSKSLGGGKNTAIGHTVGQNLGKVIGKSLGETYESIPKQSGVTLGLALEEGLGDQLGSVLGTNMSNNIVANGTGKKGGKSVGELIGDAVNNNTTNIALQNQIQQSFNNLQTTPTLPLEVEEAYKKFSGIDLILDRDSTGGNTHKELEQLLASHGTNKNFDKELGDMIPSSSLRGVVKKQLTTQPKTRELTESLATFVMSFANKEKSSQEHLTTTLVNVNSTFKNLLNNHLTEPTEQKHIDALDTFIQGMTGKSIKDSQGNIVQDVEATSKAHIQTELEFVHSHYKGQNGTAEELYKLTQDPVRAERLSSFYINANKYANNIKGNVTEVGTSNNPKHEADLGGRDKTMSWMSSKQLRDNGFTNKELGYYSKLSSHTAADHQIITMLYKKPTNTLNSQIKTKEDEIKLQRVLGKTKSERRAELKRQGFNIDGLVGSYELKAPVKEGFKSVPIILEDTHLFGDYLKNGVERSKKASNHFDQMIDLDFEYQRAESDISRKRVLERMNTLTEELKKQITPLLSGSDNMGKRFATRQALNGTYSRALPVNGSLVRYREAEQLSSVGSVSMKGLRHRLSGIDKQFLGGVDIHKLSNEELLQQSFIRKTKEDGLFEVMLSHNGKEVPLHALVTREPSAGPGSTSMTKLMLDITSTAGEGYINIGANDKFTKLYKFLDFDADQMLEAQPHYQAKDFEGIIEAYNKGMKFNSTLEGLYDFTEVLGVKGKKEGITTFLDIANRDNVTDAKSFIESYINEIGEVQAKNTARKTTTAEVTSVSQDISESITKSLTQSHGNNGISTERALRARTLSHYLTENLIKTMHTKVGGNTVTPAEILGKHLRNGDMQSFNSALGSYVEENLVSGSKVQGIADGAKKDLIVDQIRQAVADIRESMSSHKKEDSLATPLGLKHTEDYNKAIENYEAFTGGKATNPIVALDEDIGKGVVHTAKKSYYTALEGIKDNISRNKNLLMGAGAFVGATAILTQHKPDFGNNHAQANTGGMLLSSGSTAIQDTANELETRNSSHPATEYIHKIGSTAKQMTIQSQRMDDQMSDQYQDMNQALLGDGMSSIRLITS